MNDIRAYTINIVLNILKLTFKSSELDFKTKLISRCCRAIKDPMCIYFIHTLYLIFKFSGFILKVKLSRVRKSSSLSNPKNESLELGKSFSNFRVFYEYKLYFSHLVVLYDFVIQKNDKIIQNYKIKTFSVHFF